MSKNIYDGIVPEDIIRMEEESEELPVFEAPIWAHRHMRKAGLDPHGIEDWREFRRYCE